MSEAVRYVGVFVGIVALVLAAATTGALVVDDTPTRTDATVSHDYYTSEEMVSEASMTSASGDVTFTDDGTQKTVVVHASSQQTDIDPLVSALLENGHEVRLSGSASTGIPFALGGLVSAAPRGPSDEGPPLREQLRDADALVVVGAADDLESGDQSARQSEQDADVVDDIETFAEAGGRVLIAEDPTGGGVSEDANALASRFGLGFGSGYLYNMHDNGANYQSVYAEPTDSAESELDADVGRLVVHQAAPVHTGDGTPVAEATDETRDSLTRETGTYHIAARNGNVVAVGDTNIFSPTHYNRADNEVFIGNLLEFLTTGDRDSTIPEFEQESNGAGSSGAQRPQP